MTFPEQVGPFTLYRPDPAESRASWAMADGGGWLPALFADRDACLIVGGWLLGGGEIAVLERLRDRHNRARPSAGITVGNLVQEITPADPVCLCCTLGNHTEPCTCDGNDCCHPERHDEETT